MGCFVLYGVVRGVALCNVVQRFAVRGGVCVAWCVMWHYYVCGKDYLVVQVLVELSKVGFAYPPRSNIEFHV